MTGNAFKDADRRVHGAWYGNARDEAAGTVFDQRSSVNLIGAFGTSR